MKATLKKSCRIEAVAWDNGGVLVQEDWITCYDGTYEKLSLAAPLAGSPSRGKQYKKMLSVPIAPRINVGLHTFIEGHDEHNYFHSYCSGHISSPEFWPVTCRYRFGLSPTSKTIDALRAGQSHLLEHPGGSARIFPRVVDVLKALSSVLLQSMLSNIYPRPMSRYEVLTISRQSLLSVAFSHRSLDAENPRLPHSEPS